MARLKQANCGGPGLHRRRRGKGFEYLDEEGHRITDPEVVERITELTIPPAWQDVWICPYPMGHIQATGVDAAGRKQYLYHEKWRQRQDKKKFNSMVEFAKALPEMRAQVERDLKGKGITRTRVLAASVRLLDRGFLRIGGESYAEDNDSYGLATMRKDHVTVDANDAINFDFTGKSGIRHVRYVVDEPVAEIVRELKRRRGGGDELLAYRDDDGKWRDIKSPDIRAYVKETAGDDYTAKDFRTWAGTVLAAVTLAATDPQRRKAKTANKRMISFAVKQVAYFLGNTPAVARAAYIDPRVLDRFRDGYTIEPVLMDLGEEPDLGQPAIQGRVEEAVLHLINEHRTSKLVEKAA
ncbi:MAG: topoisomerase [Thermoleophilaceae bacterium]|jgi:DNA topoisomerase IB|nr:topoisomerase [Thermoleophilaceae bacterium]